MSAQPNTLIQLLPAVGLVIYIPFAIWSARDYERRCGRVHRPARVRFLMWLQFQRERRAEQLRQRRIHAEQLNDAELRRLWRERQKRTQHS